MTHGHVPACVQGKVAGVAGGAWVNADVRPMGWGTPETPGWLTRTQAVLWTGDTLRLVGSSDEVRAEAKRLGLPVADLGGRVVVPGLVDAHTHFLHVGVKTTRPDLRGAKSKREALQRVAAWLAAHPGSDHVIAEGWDESEWGTGASRPTRDEIDALVAAAAKDGNGPLDRPVVLRRICGHIAVAGSGALPLVRARWNDDVAVNLQSGLLLEAPSLYLNEVLPSTPAQLDRAVQEACKAAHRLGVTTVGDYSQAPYRAALLRAAAAGTLSVRTAGSIYVQQLTAEIAAGFRTGRLAPGPSGSRDSPWMRDGGLKVFLDGSLGARTALLREPYLEPPTNGANVAPATSPHGKASGGEAPSPLGAKGSGVKAGGTSPAAVADDHAGHGHDDTAGGVGPCGSRIWTDAQLDAHVGTAHAAGIQVHAHAIGDGAIDQGLAAFERLAAREALEGRGWLIDRPGGGEGGAAPGPVQGALRHRFEHFEIVHDEQVAAAVALGLVSSSQPNFVGEWSAKGGMYEARLGARFRLNNRFRSFKEAGLAVAFGSDGMPFGALPGLSSAVRHPDPTQRLSPEEAIWHYTTMAAWSLHWEDAIGALAPGLKADLVALETKDLSQDPNQWGIRCTVTGGTVRFGTP